MTIRRRGLLLGLAGLGMAALFPLVADSETPLELLATHLAGLPVRELPAEVIAPLQQIAQQLGRTPPNSHSLRLLAQRWPPARQLYKEILTALYTTPQGLAWDAVPFAARPVVVPLDPPLLFQGGLTRLPLDPPLLFQEGLTRLPLDPPLLFQEGLTRLPLDPPL